MLLDFSYAVGIIMGVLCVAWMRSRFLLELNSTSQRRLAILGGMRHQRLGAGRLNRF